jgi:hypothetical protein
MQGQRQQGGPGGYANGPRSDGPRPFDRGAIPRMGGIALLGAPKVSPILTIQGGAEAAVARAVDVHAAFDPSILRAWRHTDSRDDVACGRSRGDVRRDTGTAVWRRHHEGRV